MQNFGKVKSKEKLYLYGGLKTRYKPMPPRLAFNKREEDMVAKVIKYYKKRNLDPGYQGVFENNYCKSFCKMMGGGYADAVATGTIAIYVGLAALNLPKKSEVLVSSITDPGTISAIIMQNLIPKLADCKKNNYNIGLNQVRSRVSKKTSCVIVVHALGQVAEVDKIVSFAKSRNIKVLEDCSQAHGAKLKNKKVGTFGDIAAFSTMYRKASISGATGGIVYSKKLNLLRLATAHADRGKERWKKNFDDRNPEQYIFPALNFHTNEISCAIGISSLKRLNNTISKRLNYVRQVSKQLKKKSKICTPSKFYKSDSPFVYPIIVDTKKIKTNKINFAKAILAEGISLNPHYRYLVSDWPWVKKYLKDNFDPVNAREIRDKTFNLYLNENYKENEVKDTVNAILKVEKAFIKN